MISYDDSLEDSTKINNSSNNTGKGTIEAKPDINKIISRPPNKNCNNCYGRGTVYITKNNQRFNTLCGCVRKSPLERELKFHEIEKLEELRNQFKDSIV